MATLSILRFPRREQRTSLANGDPWLVQLLGRGTQTSAGVWVTPESALRVTAVLSAVQVIAQSVAQLPLVLYRRTAAGKSRAPENPLYSTLHDAPNRWQTSFEWREMMTSHVLLRGNAYSEIFQRGDGSIGQLVPLNPDRIRPFRRDDGSIWYEFTPISGPRRLIAADEMMHLRGLSNDGVTGLSPIALAREAIGLGMAAEEYESRFFSNDATPAVVLKTPKALTVEAAKRLKQSWQEAQSGLPNAHKAAVLEEGLDVATLGVTNRDAEFLALRKYQVAEIARIFRVPLHMLAELDRATFSNIEQQSLEFVIYSLMPWLRRWEGVIARDLMSAKMRAGYFAEFLVDGLLRGDVAARGAFYVQMIQNGVLSPNEVREMENRNPRDGGDTYLEPMNMVPQGAAPAPRKTPAAELPAGGESDDPAARIAALCGELRKAVHARVSRLVRKEVTAVRRMAKKYPPDTALRALEAEIETFYSEFEGAADHVRESRRELRSALISTDPAALELLLAAWERERADLITAKEMVRWEQ
jgi:HK97 family phage portal protein